MTNGWTGGQYSAYRGVFGLYLLIHFVVLRPAGPAGSLVGTSVIAACALLCACFAVGFRDRAAAVLLCCVWVWLGLRNLPSLGPGTLAVAWLLLAHVVLPAAPFGSWDARRRADPAGGWWMPGRVHVATRVVLAVSYSYNFVDFSPGMVFLHVLAFDPAWIRPAAADGSDVLFYDGACGLCHAAVRAVLAEDPGAGAFRFAPLGGKRFHALVPESERARLPDSIVVFRPDRPTLTRTGAIVYIGKRLGGFWRPLSSVVGWVPEALADRVYDAIAAIRHRLFARPPAACPILPARLRQRFDD